MNTIAVNMCVDVVPTKLVKTARSKEDANSEFAVHKRLHRRCDAQLRKNSPADSFHRASIGSVGNNMDVEVCWEHPMQRQLLFFDSVLKAHNVEREP